MTLFRYSAEGRTPSEEEWSSIFRNVSKLKMDLDRVQLDFHDSSIISGSPERNKAGHLNTKLGREVGNGNSSTNAHGSDEVSTSNPAVEVPLGNGTVTDQPSDLESKETSDEQPPTGDEERVESIDAI